MPNKNKEDELALLRSKVTELESTVLTLRQSLSESELTIQSLVEKHNLARRKRFGSSSETLPPQDGFVSVLNLLCLLMSLSHSVAIGHPKVSKSI